MRVCVHYCNSQLIITQVLTRLNHMNVTISYTAMMKLITGISEQHKAPIEKWVNEGTIFQFVGDNVDKTVGVRDIRTDHRSTLVHMYSLLAVRARVDPPPPIFDFIPPDLTKIAVSYFLPNQADVDALRSNLQVIVSRVLADYIGVFKPQKRRVVAHIQHAHSKEMKEKSGVEVLDVLHKCETKTTDMIDIMREMISYLGDSANTRLSVGDLLTKERQDGSKRHVICSNTPSGRLDHLEPCIADWHCLLNFLMVWTAWLVM